MKLMAAVLAGCALAGGLFAAPLSAHALTRQQFEDKAIPLLDKTRQAGQLLKLCDEALRTDAKADAEYHAFVRVLKSHAHTLRQEFAKAEAEARAVIESGHQEELGYSALMDVLFATGKYDEGRAACMQGADKMENRETQIAAREDCQEQYIQKAYVRVDDLWYTFKLDAAQATKRYRGQQVTVRGKVEQVDSSEARVYMSGAKDAKKSVMFDFSTRPTPAASQTDASAADSTAQAPTSPVDAATVPTTELTKQSTGKSKKSNTPQQSNAPANKGASSDKLIYSLDPTTGIATKTSQKATNPTDAAPNDTPAGQIPSEKQSREAPLDKKSQDSKAQDISTDSKATQLEDQPASQPENDPVRERVMPPVGSTATIIGTVRGMEHGQLVLTDCTVVGQ